MQIGIALHSQEAGAGQVDTFLHLAHLAEDLGYDSLWAADHNVVPTHDLPRLGERWIEPLVTLATLAAHTKRVRLGTDVLVLAYRHPLVTAKQVATLDRLSGGRFILGAGTGYIEPEFRTLGIPFEDRGDRMDEYIRVLHQVWSTDGAQSFHGRFVQFDGMHVEPRPVQRPWPPIWVAGNGPRVLRRAVELAEGWHPLEPPLAELEAGIARMEALCVKTGRQRRPYVSICFRRLCFGPTAHMAGTGADRRMLNGSTMDVLHDLRELRKRGVGHLVVRFMPGDRGWRDVEEAMRLFANVRGEVGD